jgi:hypothetical protein
VLKTLQLYAPSARCWKVVVPTSDDWKSAAKVCTSVLEAAPEAERIHECAGLSA